ncbi:MAG: sugar transferase [Prevotellaceae bacterium]|nr:sugar transferase [Candidatus Colivivens equi]
MDNKISNIDGMNSVERIIKRILDIMGAFVGLILFSPLFLIIYLQIKMQGDGPAIFSQERIGKGGKSFLIYKFRTMVVDAEAEGAMLAKEDDSRLTNVGRFLREHHLDELPQLWNVLIGDMSFVGYRPERKVFIDQIMEHNSDYKLLYVSRPGVTSYATLYNGYTDTMDKMLRRLDYDLEYLRRRSLILDAQILFKTFTSIVGGKVF